MLSGYKNRLEKYREGPGKVLEFRVSNVVETLVCVYVCTFVCVGE